MPRKKRKSPSRERYEAKNPTVSGRVPRELRDRLRIAKEAEGMSYIDVLKVGLGLIEVKMRKEEELRLQGYDEGYEDASNASEAFVVTYRCVKCGKEIIVDTDEEKKAIAKYMREHGWTHGDCLNR